MRKEHEARKKIYTMSANIGFEAESIPVRDFKRIWDFTKSVFIREGIEEKLTAFEDALIDKTYKLSNKLNEHALRRSVDTRVDISFNNVFRLFAGTIAICAFEAADKHANVFPKDQGSIMQLLKNVFDFYKTNPGILGDMVVSPFHNFNILLGKALTKKVSNSIEQNAIKNMLLADLESSENPTVLEQVLLNLTWRVSQNLLRDLGIKNPDEKLLHDVFFSLATVQTQILKLLGRPGDGKEYLRSWEPSPILPPSGDSYQSQATNTSRESYEQLRQYLVTIGVLIKTESQGEKVPQPRY